jgi:uncharacterized protein
MERENTARTAANMNEATTVTYVEAAQHGKNQGWRYLLGLVAILVFWPGVGGIATRLVAFSLAGQEGLAALGRLDFTAFGPVGGFVVSMTAFPFLLAGILIAVTRIHRRHPRTLVTARERIHWRRVGQGFLAWFVSWCLVLGVGQYLLHPDAFSFVGDLAAFARFVPLALVLTAIQTTTEELLFRGYFVQGASRIWANRVFLALVAAVIFTLPHFFNPEAQAGWLTVFIGYFVSGGLFWAIVSLVDGTTELAIGAHFAHNICSILVVNHTGTVFTTPALISVGEYNATFPESSLLVMIVLFLAIIYGVFKRTAPTRSPEPSAGSSATPVEF